MINLEVWRDDKEEIFKEVNLSIIKIELIKAVFF